MRQFPHTVLFLDMRRKTAHNISEKRFGGVIMTDKNGLRITARDRVLRAWQDSTELVRDYQAYAGETSDSSEISAMFSRYAEDEAVHAAELLKVLHRYDR